MTKNEAINGWTFEETIQCAENLMEEEKNIFKWDVLRHLRDFAENYKEEIQQYRAIGTVEELQAFKSNDFTEDLLNMGYTKGLKNGYAKAIDEFAEALKEKAEEMFGQKYVDVRDIDEIAEQLKGVRNE